ncbi:ATP-binding protein [Candidatus Woesearchaeota archaeon]|nr:ATP-binding protein [Candidatus Woesearchaeota archaeon]
MKDILKQVAVTSFENTGIFREQYVSQIESWLDRPEIIIIKGIRRSGKTTILQQIASRSKQKSVYINFDDYMFLQNLGVALLDAVLELFPKQDYYFFDEIQKVPGFEKWLRTHYDIKTHKKFIVSGSNISLFAPSLGTVLTGRNITFEVFPFDYAEAKDYATFEDYLLYGGFPEVILEKDAAKKRLLLLQYFNDILLRDIFERYPIVATQQFKALAQYIISNTGLKISANKLAKELGINSRSAENYLSYLIDAYLIFEVPFFSYSAKTKYASGRASKYYALDNGLAFALSAKINKGHLCESLVAQKLRRSKKDSLYYWFGKHEVDFVSDNLAYNVVSSTAIPEREVRGLQEIKGSKKHIQNIVLLSLSSLPDYLGVENTSIEEFLQKDIG